MKALVNWIKNLFSSSDSSEVSTQPTEEAVKTASSESKRSAKDPFDPNAKIQRAPRALVSGLHDISFLILTPDDELEFKVSNISISGMGILRNEKSTILAKGEVIQGTLILNRERVPVEIEIMHDIAKVIGVRFNQSPDLLRNQITRYFDVELTAAEMRPINPKFLKEQDDGNPHWFKSGDQAELFLVEKNNELVRFHMSFLGIYVEGGATRPTRSGRIIDDFDTQDERTYKASSVVQFEDQMSQLIKQSALRLIDGLRGIDAELKKQVEAKITNP